MNDRDLSPVSSFEETGTRTFLLIEAEQAILDSISLLLEARGHRVFAVASVAAATQVMQQNSKEIDCLIIDYSISDSNGLQLLNRFRSNGWKHPAVLCSDSLVKRSDHPDAQYWPEHVLAKPYCYDRLQKAISIAFGI